MQGGRGGHEKTEPWEYVILCVCIGFYLLFPLTDGPVWCVDSGGYVSMHITREPLYPSFLALCRVIAKVLRTDALLIAVLIQSLLAGVVTWIAGYVVRRVKRGSRILQLMTVLFQFAVTFLCRFAANRGSAYTDSILTEGLGMPLFVLFVICLFLYIRTWQSTYLCLTLSFSFLLISLRKQMMITLLVMGIVFAWYMLVREKSVRRFLCLAVMIAGVFLAGKLFDRTYQYAVRGVWMEHSGNSMGLLCTLLYSSDVEEDQELFEDETVKELYLKIMSRADEQQLLYDYAESGWLSVSSHYADSYDAIGYGIINPVVEGYLAEHFRCSEPEMAMKYDEICGEMSRTLMRQSTMPMLQVYIYNMFKGLVNSIAQANRLLSIYAVAAYLAAVAAAVYLIRKKKELERRIEANAQTEAAQRDRELIGQIDCSLCFMFIVTTGIMVNALVVGLVIFAQPRYMIYGMGLFYTAGSMMGYDIINCRKKLRR
ncbi:MAG: hypothetical protein K2O65_15495 [Lachnospiraceae bacterium]|nr:hypothetical protein [Lachnospiraceae bacterium]